MEMLLISVDVCDISTKITIYRIIIRTNRYIFDYDESNETLVRKSCVRSGKKFYAPPKINRYTVCYIPYINRSFRLPCI